MELREVRVHVACRGTPGDSGKKERRVSLAPAPACAGRRPRVLVAEDDFEMRELLVLTLNEAGCEVVEARDGVDFLRHLESFLLDPPGEAAALGEEPCPRYDLIVSDVRMPGASGLEVLRGEAALNFCGPRPPVIVITAFGDDEARAAAAQLGAAAFLEKPFDMQDFLQTVLEVLHSADHAGKR